MPPSRAPLELRAIEEAMGEAVYLAERKLKEVLGDDAVVVVNVAGPDYAFGSYIAPGASSMLAASLRQSASEADDE